MERGLAESSCLDCKHVSSLVVFHHENGMSFLIVSSLLPQLRQNYNCLFLPFRSATVVMIYQKEEQHNLHLGKKVFPQGWDREKHSQL